MADFVGRLAQGLGLLSLGYRVRLESLTYVCCHWVVASGWKA